MLVSALTAIVHHGAMVDGYMERPENKWVYVLTSYIQMIIMWILDLMVTLNEGPKFKDQ